MKTNSDVEKNYAETQRNEENLKIGNILMMKFSQTV